MDVTAVDFLRLILKTLVALRIFYIHLTLTLRIGNALFGALTLVYVQGIII